jgi:hypothetical protein
MALTKLMILATQQQGLEIKTPSCEATYVVGYI